MKFVVLSALLLAECLQLSAAWTPAEIASRREWLEQSSGMFVGTMGVSFAPPTASRKSDKTKLTVPQRVSRSIQSAYSGALPNKDLLKAVSDTLSYYDYLKTDTLVATSLCCDEVNRPLEKEFGEYYGEYFSMGGLAGFPFSGVTGFGAMAKHIPDDGNCLIIYGPHVGIDDRGKIGYINRRGKTTSGSCCGSATAALGYVEKMRADGEIPQGVPSDMTMLGVLNSYVGSEVQQNYVQYTLLQYADELEESGSPIAEVPYALLDAQTKLMNEIVQKGAGKVAGEGLIALLGGIQINTPSEMSDYFLPLNFKLYNNKGKMVDDLL